MKSKAVIITLLLFFVSFVNPANCQPEVQKTKNEELKQFITSLKLNKKQTEQYNQATMEYKKYIGDVANQTAQLVKTDPKYKANKKQLDERRKEVRTEYQRKVKVIFNPKQYDEWIKKFGDKLD